jgi:hypothetical protein
MGCWSPNLSGLVTTVGATGVPAPLGGLAYDVSSGQMYAISAGGSAVIGTLDSCFGVPIEEGDILTAPIGAGLPPCAFMTAEALGLGTARSGSAGPFGVDDLDGLDLPEPGFGLQLAVGLAFLATLGRRRTKE